MKRIFTFSCFLITAAVLSAQQNIPPQNLFTMTPAEKTLFNDIPASWFPLQWTGYEGPSLKGFWDAFDQGVPPVPLNASQDPGGWFDPNGTGSQNHSLLWMGESALGHALAGNVAQYEIAAQNCIKLLDSLDLVQGHMRHEAFGLYIGFWEGGMAGMALAGLYAPAGSTSGPALLKSARRWWADHVALLRRVRLPDGQVARLGARMNHGQPGEDDMENLSCALNLQLIDPLPYNVLHPSLAARITVDGKPQKLQSGYNPVTWSEPRAVAERWIVLRAFQSGAILRVPADHSTPTVIQDVYKWTSGAKTYFATPSVTGYPNCRWKVSWQSGQFVQIEVSDTGNTNGGKGPHPAPAWQPALNIPPGTPKILGSAILSTPAPPCASAGSCTYDAAIVSIVKPFHNGCTTTINPQIVVRNEGANAITELAVYYQIDNNTLYSQYAKGAIKSKRFAATPGLLPDSTATLTLDVSTTTAGTHTLTVWVMDVNRVTDKNAVNDKHSIQFTVVNTGKAAIAYSEDFESTTAGSIPADWSMYDADANANWFVHAASTNKAAAFNNFAYAGAKNYRDELVTPVIDLTGNPSLYLSFDLCHASKPAPTLYDSLEVMISTDCGNTFTSIWGKGGTALNTVADNAALFIPAGPQDYQNVKVDVGAFAASNKAIFKFVNWSNNGNSTLIDNIKFTTSAVTGMEESNTHSLNVFPNPATESLQVGCQLVASGELKMKIVNSLGQIAEDINYGVQPSGFHASTVDVRNYPAGIYNIMIFSGNTQVMTRKIVVTH